MKKKTKRSIQWVKKTEKPQKRASAPGGRQKYAGIHLIAEFWNGRIIEDPKKIEKILIEAAKKSKNNSLETVIHKFQPQGITGVILLAESHIALHAWPEINYLAIDIFTCGKKAIPYKALEYFKKVFKPKKVEIKEIRRGKLNGKLAL